MYQDITHNMSTNFPNNLSATKENFVNWATWYLDTHDKYTADYLTMFMHSLLKYHVTITQYVINRIIRSLLFSVCLWPLN